MGVSYEIEVKCDWCEATMGNHSSVFCKVCYERLETVCSEQEAKIKELQDRFARLEEEGKR